MSDPPKPALEIGTMVAHYRLIGKIGEGGMGEVYRARDTKLGRDVALKILPQAMVHDAQRMGRFKREAQVLASLNHPNIAAIHGLEESNGVHALVMELVEGETLAERLVAPASGRHAAGTVALPPDETFAIARQMAEALEYAHERGVIHRDLKPANVKITPEGTVKVLDFGLAKVLNPQDSTGAMDRNNSPTLTMLATEPGMLLGTPAYMSPEQAKGQRLDRRTDIWAFGCVLYEMLSGRKAFQGETITDVLAAVLTKEPDWNALPQSTPLSIQKLVRRCLVKDSKQRLRDIGDARITIEETISGVGEGSALPTGSTAQREGAALPYSDSQIISVLVKRHRGKVAVFAALIAAIIVVGGYLGYRALRPAAAAQEVSAPASSASMKITQVTTSGTAVLAAISPEGRYAAYVQEGAGGQSLWLRQIATGSNVQIIPPVADKKYDALTFSPDGNYLDYVGEPQNGTEEPDLYRVPALGGQSSKLLENVPTAVTFSPNGGRMAFVRYLYGTGETQLVLAGADGSGGRVLARRELPKFFWDSRRPCLVAGRQSDRRERRDALSLGISSLRG